MHEMIRPLLSFMRKPRLGQRVWRKFLSLFFIEQWIILISTNANGSIPAWHDFKPITPPPDRSWADPFPWTHEGRHYIFIEELPHSTAVGHISCLTLDKQFNLLSSHTVLKRPYHLSYPFLFKHNGQLYMLPETMKNHAIELYRCVQFPDQWELIKTLISNIRVVDPTLFNSQGRWWLFATVEGEGSYQWDTLHLYSADNPLSNEWIPYFGNPIEKDINNARSAGNIVSHDGNLFRPSQDCSVRYGYAINFNQILQLSETGYIEKQERTFKPPTYGNILCTHTWNETDDLIVIDALMRRRRF